MHMLEIVDLATNLLSVSKICAKGFQMLFTKEGYQVLMQNGEVFALGTAERRLYRLNRREMDRMRSMLNDVNLSKRFWVEEVNTAVYLNNRRPT